MFCVILLVPETAYRRDSVVPILVSDKFETGSHMKSGQGRNLQYSEKITAHQRSGGGPEEMRHTYLQSLRIFTGRYSDAPIWKIMLRPVVMWFYPAVLWAFLIYGKLVSNLCVYSSQYLYLKLTTLF